MIIKPVTELTFISFHSSALYIYIQVFVQVCAIFLLRDGERQGREGVKGEGGREPQVDSSQSMEPVAVLDLMTLRS